MDMNEWQALLLIAVDMVSVTNPVTNPVTNLVTNPASSLFAFFESFFGLNRLLGMKDRKLSKMERHAS